VKVNILVTSPIRRVCSVSDNEISAYTAHVKVGHPVKRSGPFFVCAACLLKLYRQTGYEKGQGLGLISPI